MKKKFKIILKSGNNNNYLVTIAIGKKYYKQVYIDNEFKKRIMLPLSLSYDHRIIDGAEAARFCNDLKENLGKNFAYKLAI